MVYDVVSGYGLPTRDSDAVQRLLMLRRTTEQPEITTAKISTTTYTLTEGTAEPITTVTEPPNILSDYTDENASIQGDPPAENLAESSQALPYRYTSLPVRISSKDDKRFSNREFRSNFEIDSFFREEARNLPPKRRKEQNSRDNHGIDDYAVYWSHHQPPRNVYGIQSRIMNNVKYQIPRPFRARNFTIETPEHNSFQVLKDEQQASIPYYSFGSLSKYPQLSTYRYPNEAKNIQDIIKYLTTEESNNPSSSNNKQATFSFVAPTENGRRIKFAGVYKTALKKHSGEDYSRPEESVEDTVISSERNKMPDSSFNGHAYIADPFHDFKPSDPSEINLLANSDFRFSPFDSRVRFVPNRPQGTRLGVIEINPNDKFFPRPPIYFGKPSTTAPPHEPVYQSYPGTYTTAIYRPLGKEPVTTTPHSSTKTPKSVKPFSVMLDIYPMMEDSTPQATSVLPHKPLKPFVKPGHGLGPRVRFPQGRPPDPVTDSETKHQMVVHLNLYPKRKKKHNFSDRYSTVPTELPSMCQRCVTVFNRGPLGAFGKLQNTKISISFKISIYFNIHHLWPSEYSEGHKFTTAVLLYEYMDQYCKHNGIPLCAYFIYLNLDSILV